MEAITVFVTAKGKKILEERLAVLLAGRQEAAEAIREAREFGDLKENAEYAAAREAQANLEDEINDINTKMQNLKMFSYAKADTKKVGVGSRVKISEVGGKKVQEWTITGIVESDPANFYISNETPIAKNLMGKGVGEIVEIHTPSGVRKYKVESISAGA